MEQVQSGISLSNKPWYEKFFARGCRQLVFTALNKLEGACVEIHENGQVHLLGDQQASLWGVIDIHDESTYNDFIKGGSIGGAEAFIAHKWSSPDLTSLVRIFARAQRQLDDIEKGGSWVGKLKNKVFHGSNANSRKQSKENILAHYDLGNDLYRHFLDEQMMYSAAIYQSKDESLEQAQIRKLDAICERLELKAGEHLVEIGTGWGGLAIHAAKNYGVKVTTTTISDAQWEYANQRVNELGLSDQITLLKNDYRDLTGQYDKLVSIEMIEAVGHEYFKTFFKKCDSLVKPGGKMLLQAITIADQRYDHYRTNVDFIQRYIFPGGCLPSVQVISHHVAENTEMVIEQLHDIGLHYAQTLKDWRERFEANWSTLKEFGYDDTFKRMWLYYLQYCEGAFLERATSTVHVVARK